MNGCVLIVKIKENTGCPTKKFTFFKPVYLRPLMSLRKSSVLEMNLWISSFKNTNSKFSRIFVFKDIKGIRYYSCFSGYSWPTFDTSEMIWRAVIFFGHISTIKSDIDVVKSKVGLIRKNPRKFWICVFERGYP